MTYLTYSQASGEIRHVRDDGSSLIGVGWAGKGEGKNNPALQDKQSLGPLPVGWYTIGKPFKHPTCGPFSLRLTPDPENEMFGRSGFLIHGASLDSAKYGQESRGCIVAPRPTRVAIYNAGITRLQVML